MRKMSVAVQVYSVRNEAEKDFRGTIKKIKEMGYDGVELAGLYGLAPEEIRDILAEAGLTAISAHVPYLTLLEDMAGTIAQYAVIGCAYIAIPYLNEEYRPGTALFEEVRDNIVKIGQMCAERNIKLLYHNHDFEFAKMPDGRYALDYLYETIPPSLLETEIDTCWVRVAGIDPAEYIKKYAGRSPLVHLKDYVGERSANMYALIGIEREAEQAKSTFEFRAVGDGVQDFKSILEAADASGADWVVVEQDAHYSYTAMEDIKRSVDYLRKAGL